MSNKIGNLCMILGSVLLLAALSLFIMNRREEQLAEDSVRVLLPQVIEQIENERMQSDSSELLTGEDIGENDLSVSVAYQELYDTEMTEVEIDGYSYIGYVSIPALELDLPVMAEWDYPRLKVAPCRYTGSTKTDDLVIAAHNYSRHFGKISQLKEGDQVVFTDMDGTASVYEVVALDVLAPTAIEEMTAGDYDLTLFTCTYGGESRVTLRCDRVQ